MNFRYILIKSFIILLGLLNSQELPDSIIYKSLNNFNYKNFKVDVKVSTEYKNKNKNSNTHFIFNQVFDHAKSVNKNMVELVFPKELNKVKYWRHQYKDTSYYWKSMPITGNVKKIRNRNQIKKINGFLNVFEKDIKNMDIKDLGIENQEDKVIHKIKLIFRDKQYSNEVFAWINSENYLLTKLEIINEKHELVERITFFDYKQVGDKFFAQHMLKESIDKNIISKFEISNMQLNSHKDLSIFEPIQNK